MTDATDKPIADREGPHQRITATNDRERFAIEVFDRLWIRYRSRVEHVVTYENIVREAQATFVNDHIALRTFACQQPVTGIASIARVIQALGYRAAGAYDFAEKHLNAVHFQHANPDFPKLFVSELKVWELSQKSREIIERSLVSHREALSHKTLAEIINLNGSDQEQWSNVMDLAVRQFHELPWELPEKQDVQVINQESQYAAWVLVHGYNVNHFTALVNSHNVASLDDIEKTAAALRQVNVPMKTEIEGERGSKLRQTATAAAVIDVDVRDQGQTTHMPWTYAYFELAERGQITEADSGRRVRFEGFLGPQATHLFEMTKKS